MRWRVTTPERRALEGVPRLLLSAMAASGVGRPNGASDLDCNSDVSANRLLVLWPSVDVGVTPAVTWRETTRLRKFRPTGVSVRSRRLEGIVPSIALARFVLCEVRCRRRGLDDGPGIVGQRV